MKLYVAKFIKDGKEQHITIYVPDTVKESDLAASVIMDVVPYDKFISLEEIISDPPSFGTNMDK